MNFKPLDAFILYDSEYFSKIMMLDSYISTLIRNILQKQFGHVRRAKYMRKLRVAKRFNVFI